MAISQGIKLLRVCLDPVTVDAEKEYFLVTSCSPSLVRTISALISNSFRNLWLLDMYVTVARLCLWGSFWQGSQLKTSNKMPSETWQTISLWIRGWSSSSLSHLLLLTTVTLCLELLTCKYHVYLWHHSWTHCCFLSTTNIGYYFDCDFVEGVKVNF